MSLAQIQYEAIVALCVLLTHLELAGDLCSVLLGYVDFGGPTRIFYYFIGVWWDYSIQRTLSCRLAL